MRAAPMVMLGVALSLCFAVGYAFAEEKDESGVFEKDVVEVGPGTVPISFVIVDNRMGDIRVEGHSGKSIIIHAFKRGPDNAALDRLKVTLVPDPNGPVRIGTRLATGTESQPLAKGAVRIDLVIRAPSSAGVKAEVWNGKLQVASMDNGAELRANEGEIDVRNCSGRILTRIANGDQHLAEIVGDVEAQGLTGDMELDVVRGKHLTASLHQGDVTGRKIRSRNVAIRVTKGSVSFHGELVVGGSYSITTYQGNVEVKFGGAPINVRARARRGDVKLPPALRPATDEDGWVSGHQRRAGAPAMIHLATTVGNIRVATF